MVLVVLSKLPVAAAAVEEVGIPPLLRDFQARWKSPAFWTFPRSGIFHRPIRHFRLRAKLFDTKLSRHMSQTR
jgi:hypothetical protein